MSLQDRLVQDMKSALKAGEKVRLETIRGLRGQIKNAQIAKGDELTDEEVLHVLMQAAKKRKESIEQFNAVGREDRAREEQEELTVIESYLPEQMSEAEITDLVKTAIAETGAESVKDMGKVMGAIMPKVKGKADGKVVQQIVRKLLGS